MSGRIHAGVRRQSGVCEHGRRKSSARSVEAAVFVSIAEGEKWRPLRGLEAAVYVSSIQQRSNLRSGGNQCNETCRRKAESARSEQQCYEEHNRREEDNGSVENLHMW
jgi:hypothetical protein